MGLGRCLFGSSLVCAVRVLVVRAGAGAVPVVVVAVTQAHLFTPSLGRSRSLTQSFTTLLWWCQASVAANSPG